MQVISNLDPFVYFTPIDTAATIVAVVIVGLIIAFSIYIKIRHK